MGNKIAETNRKLSIEYSLANREVRKNLRKDKRMRYENLASQAEWAAIRGEQSEPYRITRNLSGKLQGEYDAAKDIRTGRESQSRKNSYKDGQSILEHNP